jgi:hypothetical protein
MILSTSLFFLLSTLPSWCRAATPLGPAESSLNASIKSLLSSTSITSEILQSFLAPIEVQVARNSYVVRDGTALRLNGVNWTASGANVYWLGLDENVIPPPGQPFYAKFNASYPTLGRITEAMNTLATMGARTIRSQTLGVSVGYVYPLLKERRLTHHFLQESVECHARSGGLQRTSFRYDRLGSVSGTAARSEDHGASDRQLRESFPIRQHQVADDVYRTTITEENSTFFASEG